MYCLKIIVDVLSKISRLKSAISGAFSNYNPISKLVDFTPFRPKGFYQRTQIGSPQFGSA